MERLSDIEARISSFAQLQDVISVMRSLAATRIQQAQDGMRALQIHEGDVRLVPPELLDRLVVTAPQVHHQP